MVLDFYFDLDRQVRVASPVDKSILPIPIFAQNNVITFRIRALQPTGDEREPYTLVPNTGKTLQFALGTKGGAQLHYVEQYTWGLNGDLADPYFYADVSFNTSGVVTLLNGAASAQTYLEVNLMDEGNPKRLFSSLVTVEASVIANNVLTVPAGQTALSLETALALFLQRAITGRITFVNSDDSTKRVDVYTGAEGELHQDPS